MSGQRRAVAFAVAGPADHVEKPENRFSVGFGGDKDGNDIAAWDSEFVGERKRTESIGTAGPLAR